MNALRLPDRFLILDRTKEMYTGDILYPFALDEILCRKVGQGCPPAVHIWRHQKAFVMGLRDRRLPNALGAMDWLEKQDYRVTVRNSGGAAVPLDPGVVNLSFILPNGGRTIRQDFELAYRLIALLLQEWSAVAERGEIAGAYCPGDFDVSIAGKKFCGISQRRQLQGTIVQMFVVVQGSGPERASLVREFYRVASGGMAHPFTLMIDPAKTASLESLIGIPSMEVFAGKLIRLLTRHGGTLSELEPYAVSRDEIEKTMESMRLRYEKRMPGHPFY